MPYDALHGFIPMYHAGGGPRWQKYSRFFQHLSAPAPGRGSSGVHEAGFGRFNPETLSLSPNAIPTLQVVDDTFTQASRRDGGDHREGKAARRDRVIVERTVIPIVLVIPSVSERSCCAALVAGQRIAGKIPSRCSG